MSLYLAFSLYALAQLLCTIGRVDATDCLKAVCTLPLCHHCGMRGPSYSTEPPSSDSKIWGFASLEEGQISVLMQEQRANGKEFQQGTTVILNYCSPPTVERPLQFPFRQWFL